MKTLILLSLSFFSTCCTALADRDLSSEEINTLFADLVSQPVQTWLPAGSISARRLEYSNLDKSICEYRETCHFDGIRFYREITMVSGGDEVTEGEPGQQHSMKLDRERIFCWDGTRYTQYYKSTDTAIIDSMPSQNWPLIYGAFSSGVISWGCGLYTLQNLTRCTCSAQEVWVEGHKQIHLQITDPSSSPVLHISFILDAEKNYAVLFNRIEDSQISGIEQRCSQFIQINDRWIPTVIAIEQYLKKPEGRDTVSYEDWKFESIKPDMPLDVHFSVNLRKGTLVELRAAGYPKSLMYYTNDQQDIHSLLEEKIAFSNQPDSVGKNCAAAAVQIVAKRFAKPYPASQIEALAGQANNMTSLYSLKNKLEETGLYCAALETSLESLRNTTLSQAILYLPDSSHYVILDSIDDTNVWTIDLTSRKVYWKTPIQRFARQWKRGIALIVSDNPQNLTTAGTPLSESDQQQINGGDSSGTMYSCSEQIQIDKDLYCPEPMGLVCIGRYYRYWERLGCASDPNGTGCVGEGKPGHQYTTCKTQLNSGSSACIIDTFDWKERNIRACQ